MSAMVKDPIAAVVLEHEAARAAEVERSKRLRRRADAIKAARSAGVTMRAIAQALGVTPERVRQMELAG